MAPPKPVPALLRRALLTCRQCSLELTSAESKPMMVFVLPVPGGLSLWGGMDGFFGQYERYTRYASLYLCIQ